MQIECDFNITPDMQDQWRSFLERANHQQPQQDVRFASSLIADGNDVLYATGREGKDLCAVALLEMRKHPFLPGCHSVAMAYSGPVCDDAGQFSAFLDGLVAHKALSRVGRLRVTPYWLGDDADKMQQILDTRGWRVFEQQPVRQTGIIDISGDMEQVVARFSTSTRRELRRADRQGIVIEPAVTTQAFREFLDSLNRHRTDRAMAPIPVDGMLATCENVAKGNDLGTLLIARHEGNFLGGLLCYRGRDTVHTPYFTNEPERLRKVGNLRIAPLLFLAGMNWAKERGCSMVDLEGYEKPTDPNHKMYAINKYKSELAPMQVQRVAGHEIVLNQFVNISGNGREILKASVKSALRAFR
jgi:hypothetical protein